MEEVPLLPPEELLEWIVSELLEDVQVAWVPRVGGMRSNGGDTDPPLTLRLPAEGFVPESAPLLTDRSAAPDQSGFHFGRLWRVDSLLQVLAAALVFATEFGEPGEFYPCTRCRRRARVIERRPGSRKAWFGAHGYCRQRHRADIKLEHQRQTAEQRNAARRAQRARMRTATADDDGH
jgi:hypothetical protein